MTMNDGLVDIEDLNPDDGRIKGTSRLRGRMAQWMVFINGLILTIVAFATLSIFLDQMHKSRMSVFRAALLSDVNNLFSDIDRSLIMAGVSVDSEYRDKVDTHYFQSVFNAQKQGGKSWNIRYLVGAEPKANINKILSFLEKDMKNRENFILSIAGTNATYVVHRLKPAHYSIAKIEYMALTDYIQSKNYAILSRLKIFDEISGNKIFEYVSNDPNRANANNLDHHIDVVMVGNSKLSIAFDVMIDPFFSVVNKLPYIMLLFGGILTAIGTLYIRNSQKQAYKLGLVNDALETKIADARTLYQKLSARETEYESVLNAIHDILFEIDMHGQIRFLNKKWEQITGFENTSVISKDLFQFFIEKDQDEIRGVFSQFIKERKPVFIETLLRTNDGEYRSVELSLSVLRQDQSGEKRIIGTMTDVEEQSRAERALDEVEKRYRTIVENAAGGIYQISLDGKILSANPALVALFGYDAIDQIQAEEFDIRNIFPNENNTKLYKKAIARDGFVRNHETQIRRANGEIIWVNQNERVVTAIDGTPLYYEGSLEDISQRKQAEIELLEAKLNSDLASRAKSEFLANMSHELRTPLNSIIGFSEIIKSEALGEIQQRPYVDYAKDIYASGSRLLTVINEILGISKIEAGERHLNESVVNLKTVTQTCIDLLAAKIEANSIDVTNIIDDQLPSIVAEEMAFKQMMMNLLSNAIKFTPPEGKITIASEYDGGGDLRISITDTGVGIDEGDIPKALSPFGQIDNALSRSNGGTGLGLTLVDSLIRLHGGRLELISQKGIGTTVTLVVPEKRVAVQKEKHESSNAGNVASLSDYKK